MVAEIGIFKITLSLNLRVSVILFLTHHTHPQGLTLEYGVL